jgi:predicted nucleic acid-binding protein
VIYLDSCIVIYAVEDDSARGAAVRQRLGAIGDEVVAIAPLVMLECLVGPFRQDDLALADHYRHAFDLFRMLATGVPEHVRAAELRARQGLRTPDALHLATAQLTGCRELWTNDSRLAAASHGLAVDVLEGSRP